MSAETAFKKCTCVFFSLLRTKREKKIHIKTDFFSVNHINCTYMQHYNNDIFVRFSQLFKNWIYFKTATNVLSWTYWKGLYGCGEVNSLDNIRRNPRSNSRSAIEHTLIKDWRTDKVIFKGHFALKNTVKLNFQLFYDGHEDQRRWGYDHRPTPLLQWKLLHACVSIILLHITHFPLPTASFFIKLIPKTFLKTQSSFTLFWEATHLQLTHSLPPC